MSGLGVHRPQRELSGASAVPSRDGLISPASGSSSENNHVNARRRRSVPPSETVAGCGAESDRQVSRTGHSLLHAWEDTIKTFILNLVTENISTATVHGAGFNSVTLTIDDSHHWNAEGLRKLAAALVGVAGILPP